MSDFRELLEATIQHLNDLKALGLRFVPADLRLLEALNAPLPSRASSTLAAAALEPARMAAPPAASMQPSRSTPHPAPKAVPAPLPPVQPNLDTIPSTAPVPALPALSREAKESAMAELRTRALACQKCPNLAAARKTVVFGVGDIHSPLMFVGEAPGADEDEQGEPFVGKAGQLLTRIIQTMDLSRDTVYIANILKCRPDTPGQESGNRKPTADEMKTCSPYLLEQLDLIQPRVIVALGATAVEGLLGKTVGITRLRGNWQTFRGTPVMPTYHPAYLLRNQSLSEKRRVWEDMLAVMERLGMPINERQRSFFLKP